MLQLFVVVVAIAGIPVLIRRKLSVGVSLLILGLLAGILGGLSPVVIARALIDVFAVPSTLSSVLVVIEIGMLSVLMNHYQLLKRMEDAMRKLFSNARLIIMLLPAMIGALQAPGGAVLSAAFTNHLGEEMGLTPAQRANVNVVSRHTLMLFAPFTTNMVVVKSMAPNVDIFKLGLLNLGFVVAMQAAGYFFLLRKSKPLELPPVSGGERWKALGEFFLTFSPILLVILLNTILKIPFPVALLGSILLVFLIGDRKDFGHWLVRSFSVSSALLIIGVYFFQNIVGSMEGLLALFTRLVNGESMIVFLVTVAVVGTLFGVATGLMYLPMGVLIPVVAGAAYASEMEMLIHVSYTFLFCFIGYFFSPLHLCQLLSDKETGCTVEERYRTYLPLLPTLPAIAVVLFFLYTLLLT